MTWRDQVNPDHPHRFLGEPFDGTVQTHFSAEAVGRPENAPETLRAIPLPDTLLKLAQSGLDPLETTSAACPRCGIHRDVAFDPSLGNPHRQPVTCLTAGCGHMWTVEVAKGPA